MRKFTALALAVSLTLAACSIGSSPNIVGSGHAATDQRAVESFTKVRVNSAIAATVIVGSDISVVVTADDNILPQVTTNVTAGRLDVSLQGSLNIKTPVSVAITMPSIESVEATSAATVTVTGVNGDSLSASATSAGSIVARGDANSIDVSADSAGQADLGGVPAQDATARVGSGARATVNAQISVSGSVDAGGVLRVEGSPAQVNVTTQTGGVVVRD